MPEQRGALRRELDQLARALGSDSAFVFGAWGLVWRWATFPSDQERLLAHVKSALLDVWPPLRRQSFASIYVLGIWGRCTGREFALRRALPTIERLPPPSGPGTSSGAGLGRA